MTFTTSAPSISSSSRSSSSSSSSAGLSIAVSAICYDNLAGYAAPYIYVWSALPTGSVKSEVSTTSTDIWTWPGKAMTKKGNFYCYDFASMLNSGSMPTSMGVIFNNNGNPQTANLSFTGNACYQAGVWKTLQQCGFNLDSSASSSSRSSSSSSSAAAKTRIYFKNTLNYVTPFIHYFNVQPALAGSAWPGKPMAKLADGWFSYDFDTTVTSAGIVFNNNASPQTADLQFTAPNNCYANGVWQTADACGAPSELVANAGVDRKANVNTRQVLSAAASVGDFATATWTSPAWAGALSGKQVVTPVLTAIGSHTVTLVITTANGKTSTDTMILNVVAAAKGLPERPLLAEPLKFPISGNVNAGKYRFVKAFPNLDGQFPSPVLTLADGINDLIYVVDKIGTVSVFPNNEAVTTGEVRQLLNISSTVQNTHEVGLLSMVFDPAFASNGFIYVYYTFGTDDTAIDIGVPSGDSILERWTVDNPLNPTKVQPGSRVEVLHVPQIGPDHKGGMMQFHPTEGYLYLGIGDGGYGHSALPQVPPLSGANGRTNNSSQDPSTLRGKFIRIKPEATMVNGKYYTVPSDNPFVGVNGYLPEIWSIGHRNPWRWGFDKQAPYTLWETEVGQDGYEEVNLIEKGKNYGWPVCEGLTNRGNLGGNPTKNCGVDYAPPLGGYTQAEGASIIGGVVYRGSGLPGLNGSFIFGDYVSKRIWSIAPGKPKVLVSEAFPENVASFGTDLSGETLFVTSYGVQFANQGARSAIFKVLDDNAAAAVIPPKLSGTGLFANLNELIPSAGVIEYDVNTHAWLDGVKNRHYISIPNDKTIGFDVTATWDLPVGTVLVKHASIATSNNPNKPFTTSVLFKQEAGWQAANYRWNTAGTDADLVTESVRVNDGSIENRQRVVQSASDCASCHVGSGSKNPLAVGTRQFNRVFNYQGITNNQLDVFNSIGIFTSGINNASSYDSFAAPDDASASLLLRAKSYLHTNCSHCHSSSHMDMRFDTPLENMHLIGEGGAGDLHRIAPGEPQNSVVYLYQTNDGMRMPKGTSYTNPAAASLFAEWITDLGRDPVQTGINVDASAVSLRVDESVTLSVEAVMSTGLTQGVTGSVLWSSSDTAILDVAGLSGATITPTAISAGTVTITASNGGFTKSIQLTVTGSGAVSSIAITPGVVTLTSTQQLVAFGKDSDGNPINLFGQVAWRVVTGANIVSVSSTGLLTKLQNGSAVVEASYNGMTATANITASAPGLTFSYSNPNNWAAVYIHAWTTTNGVDTPLVPWPGALLNDNDKDGWWTHFIAQSALVNGKVSVLFHNNAGAKTADFRDLQASSSYDGVSWKADVKTARLVVIGGTAEGGGLVFPVDSLVQVTADTAFGSTFKAWSGDALAYLVSNPTNPVATLLVPRGVPLLTLASTYTEEENYELGRTFFAAKCVGCHGPNGSLGLNTLHNSSWTVPALASFISDFMPKAPQNPADCVGTNPGSCAYEIAKMIKANAWFACTGDACASAALDDRNLRLLTKKEYFNTVTDIFGVTFAASLMDAVPADTTADAYDSASFLLLDYDRALGYQMVAEKIAAQVIAQKTFTNIVSGCASNDNRCVLTKLGKKLFRRPLTTAEVDRYVALYESADAGKAVIQALLISPKFLYRSEMGQLDSATGLYKLTNYELATVLSYSFWMTTPDDTLIAAAESANFNVATEATRLLNDPRSERGLRRFAQGWLLASKYGFPAFEDRPTIVASFKEETTRFILENLRANLPFENMLTANYTYVNTELAQHYGMTPVSSGWEKRVYPSGDPRAAAAQRGVGVLGHGSFLASRTNGADRPSPIKRGLFVREMLMCQEFPAPIAANITPVFEDTDSNREATERHTNDPSCRGCHQYIDGVGFGIEGLGSDALKRIKEFTKDGTERTVDTTGWIKSLHSPETQLVEDVSDQFSFASLPELAGLIAESGQGAKCYSRHFYRYMLGRHERKDKSDEPKIRGYSSGVRAGGGMNQMIIDFTSADSFKLRQ